MILNLTQHIATPEQKAAGVVDLPEDQRQQLSELLTFHELPTQDELWERAAKVIRMARDTAGPLPAKAMIGGAPFFMEHIIFYLKGAHIKPLYSFSQRVSIETTTPDGSVTKTSQFKHLGWVEA